jgi:hypothetical protein
VIELTTNGLLLKKMPDDFWDSAKRNRIHIAVSIYTDNIDYAAMRILAKSKGVLLKVFIDPTQTYNKLWWKYPIDIEGRQDAAASYEYCNLGRDCGQLKDGKLYACARIANVKYFNKQFNLDLQVTEQDYIDIYKTKDMGEVWKFLCSPVPFCKYCVNKSRDKSGGLMEWGISKKELSEWV